MKKILFIISLIVAPLTAETITYWFYYVDVPAVCKSTKPKWCSDIKVDSNGKIKVFVKNQEDKQKLEAKGIVLTEVTYTPKK